MKSPCIKICKVTKDIYCDGCFRTIEEISNWSQYTNLEKEIILYSIEERKKLFSTQNNAALAN